MSFRAAESAARPKAVEGARQLLELIRKSANAWPTIKPWVNETDIKGLTEQVTQLPAKILLADPASASGTQASGSSTAGPTSLALCFCGPWICCILKRKAALVGCQEWDVPEYGANLVVAVC